MMIPPATQVCYYASKVMKIIKQQNFFNTGKIKNRINYEIYQVVSMRAEEEVSKRIRLAPAASESDEGLRKRIERFDLKTSLTAVEER